MPKYPKRKGDSLPQRRSTYADNQEFGFGNRQKSGDPPKNFDHDTKLLLMYAEEAKHSAKVITKQQKKIHKKRDKDHSKKLEGCEEKYDVSLKDLQEAANKILEILPNTELLPEAGSSRQNSNKFASFVDGKRRTQKCNECSKMQTEIWKLQADLNSAKDDVNRLERNLKDSQRNLDEVFRTHVPESELHNWKQKYHEEKIAKEDSLRRLSAIASSKLRDNNPNITDLSDVNRPTKIGEKMSELYDNEWTDAYDELQEHFNEREVIQKLLDVIKVVYDECRSIATNHFFETIQVYIEQSDTNKDVISRTVVELPDTLKQQIKEFRKFKATKTNPYIQKLLFERIPLLKESKLQTPDVKIYINKCIELCWLMAVQDPPLFLSTDLPTRFDTNRFKDYTSRGPYIEFLVWPTVYLHEGGAILIKGVAQGCREEQLAVPTLPSRGQSNRGPSPPFTKTVTPPYVVNEKRNQHTASSRAIQGYYTRRPDNSSADTSV